MEIFISVWISAGLSTVYDHLLWAWRHCQVLQLGQTKTHDTTDNPDTTDTIDTSQTLKENPNATNTFDNPDTKEYLDSTDTKRESRQ